MLGRVIFSKYLDHGSPVVDVHIDGVIVPNNLIDMGVSINVITKETMLKINLQGALRKTTIALQLADMSKIALEGIFKDFMISINSWECPANFLDL